MPQSLSRILVHLVFSTKNREPFITAEHRERMFAYLGGTLNNIKCPVIKIGGMPDHVHLLFVLGRTLSISEVVEEIKKESSKWAKQHIHPAFYWQKGYGSFSVSPSKARRSRTTSISRKCITASNHFRTNSARCSAVMESSGTSSMSGTETRRPGAALLPDLQSGGGFRAA